MDEVVVVYLIFSKFAEMLLNFDKGSNNEFFIIVSDFIINNGKIIGK